MTNMANEIQIHSNRNERRKLTHNVVKPAKPARKTRFIRDTEIPGFALRIEPTGVPPIGGNIPNHETFQKLLVKQVGLWERSCFG